MGLHFFEVQSLLYINERAKALGFDSQPRVSEENPTYVSNILYLYRE